MKTFRIIMAILLAGFFLVSSDLKCKNKQEKEKAQDTEQSAQTTASAKEPDTKENQQSTQEEESKQEENQQYKQEFERKYKIKQVPVDETNKIMFFLAKGPCYGFCPVYKAWIYPDGKVLFEGIRNVKFEGTGVGELSDEQIKRIKSILQEVPWEELQDQYVTNVTDIPSTLVAYPLGKYYKAVYIYYVGRPPKELAILQKAVQMVEQILLKETEYEQADISKYNPPEFKVERADIPSKGAK